LLYSIERYTPAQFERGWEDGYRHSEGFVPFARDGSYYYVYQKPADVQWRMEFGDEYAALCWGQNEIIERFMADYSLEPLDI
jgi:hypothetical protein